MIHHYRMDLPSNLKLLLNSLFYILVIVRKFVIAMAGELETACEVDVESEK